MNSLLVKSLAFAALGGTAAWWSASSGPPSAETGTGLTLTLPVAVGAWRGAAGELSEVERSLLPPDTEFAKMDYRHLAEPLRIHASIVLSGKDRTSIHRPEVCLAGQGWNVRSSQERSVELANGKTLGINCLNITREVPLEDGRRRTAEAYYVYWFVGNRTTTPDNFARILNTAVGNVIHGENPRWAYVSLLSVVPASLGIGRPDAEATLREIDGWITRATPEFQRAFDPVRFF